MAKKVQAMVKLQIPAGKANPSPPVGPALGQHGVNIMEFCKGFNAQTGSAGGPDPAGGGDDLPGPVVHLRGEDAAGGRAAQARGRASPRRRRCRTRTRSARSRAQQVREIAQTKLVDLNTDTIELAMRIDRRHRPQHGHRGRRGDRHGDA